MANLGKWTLIDIETTGLDSMYDKIIDLGYLQFEGTKLVKKYSSLVRTDVPLSQFIQKLTGIKQSQITAAPLWKKVEIDLLELEGHALLAHNASFEEMFLKKYFDDVDQCEGERESYCDSMYYLSLLFPERSSLNLEGFMIDFGIADKEEHRGYEDSLALLQVLLVATFLTKQDTEFSAFVHQNFMDFSVEEFWYQNFFALTVDELLDIADQIDFDLKALAQAYVTKTHEKFYNPEDGGTKAKMEFSGQNIQKILRDEENMGKTFPGYTFRKAQEDLSLKIGQAFKNSIHALIQAPTGTGKTLGYLIPAALMSKANATQVLISTGTKTLQNQAITKDIPQLHKILGMGPEELKVIKLVGSNNHLCELMFRNEKTDDLLMGVREFDEKFAHAYFEAVFFYNERVKNYNNISTRENIPYSMKRKISEMGVMEEKIAVDYRACTGNKCPFRHGCSYVQGSRNAKEANLIIGNHALLLSWPRSSEKPPYIVIDEAHKMEGEATGAFTKAISNRELENLSKNLPQLIGPLYFLLGQEEENRDDLIKRIRAEIQSNSQMLWDHVPSFGENIERYAKKLPNFTDIYWNEIKLLGKKSVANNIEAAIYNHLESLNHIFGSTYDFLKPYLIRWELNELENDDNKVIAWTAFESLMAQLEDAVSVLGNLLLESEDLANTIKYHDDLGFTLESAPINVGKLIHENILKECESVVFTSATLANSDGSIGMPAIEWMTGYKYLESEKRFKTGMFLQNNYDYENMAKVYLCKDTPSLYDQGFVPTVIGELSPLIRRLGGRTLLLFSSRVRFEKANEYLLKEFDGEIPLFIQGMGNSVVEDFKKSEAGVLVGMESFGEGIDIPGNSLQLVYVDKIPDIRREYVIDKRRTFYDREFGNEFNDYFLASRARSLHQKIGRLIRRESDRGGVIITDSRTSKWKPRTLNTFKDFMRPYNMEIGKLSEACKAVGDFILEENPEENK